jgi:hypothetical protein
MTHGVACTLHIQGRVFNRTANSLIAKLVRYNSRTGPQTTTTRIQQLFTIPRSITHCKLLFTKNTSRPQKNQLTILQLIAVGVHGN